MSGEKEVIPYCLENNIGVVPFSPVASGFLFGKATVNTEFVLYDDIRNWVPQLKKENIAANQPVLDVISRFAAMKQVANAQISLAWMLHKYPDVVPNPGFKNQERIPVIDRLKDCAMIFRSNKKTFGGRYLRQEEE